MADTKNQQIHIFACIHHKKKKNGCKKSVLGPRKPTNTLNWIVKHVKDFMIIITNVYIIMNVITLYSFRLLHCPCVFQDVLHIISTMMSIWGHLCTAYKHNVGHWASNCVQYMGDSRKVRKLVKLTPPLLKPTSISICLIYCHLLITNTHSIDQIYL